MTHILTRALPPFGPVANFTSPLYQLAQGKLDYTNALKAGEIWTQAALRLALAAAMFFSYRFALSMGNPLLGASLIVINTCIHPRANINALYLTSIVQYISALRQFRSMRNSLDAKPLSKEVLSPERQQFYIESAAKARDSGFKWIAGLIISAAPHILYFGKPRKLDPSENQKQPTTLLQKAEHYSLWLDRKIITASKIAAPHIASFFRYQPAAQ